MGLSLTPSDGSRPNRKVNRRKAESVPPRARATREGGALSGLRRAARRVGARLWPERFPDLAVSRADRLATRETSRGFILFWSVAVALVVASFVWHLNVRFDIIQAGYDLSNAQAEQRRLRLTQRELRLELATLKEPGRIEYQAREMLGMDRPDHQRIIRLDGGRRRRLASRRGRR